MNEPTPGKEGRASAPEAPRARTVSLIASDSLALRTITGIVGIILIVGVVLLGVWPTALGISLLAGIGAWEFARMARVTCGTKEEVPNELLTIAVAVALPLAAAWRGSAGQVFVMTIGLVATILWLVFANASSVAGASMTVLGFTYTGLLMSYVQLLRRLQVPPAPGHVFVGLYSPLPALLRVEPGVLFVLMAFVATWVSDISAYFVGMAFGSHRMAPRISPKKSWEGAAGGLVCTVAFFLIAAAAPAFAGRSPAGGMTAYATAVFVGVIVGVAAQVGDLVESRMKREYHTKDAGTVLPGHGGILDRFDAFILAAPLLYLALRLMGWS